MSDSDLEQDNFAEMMGNLARLIMADDLEVLQAYLNDLSGSDLRRMKGLAYAMVGVIEAMGGGNE